MFQLNSVLFFSVIHSLPFPSHSLVQVGVFFGGVGTWEREGGCVGNTFLIMLLSKGVLHLFVHLIFRSSFLISSGCCRPGVNQIKMPAPCSSKNHPGWDMCFIILFATLCKDCRDLFCTFQELHDKNGTYKRRLHTCNHHEAVMHTNNSTATRIIQQKQQWFHDQVSASLVQLPITHLRKPNQHTDILSAPAEGRATSLYSW